MIDFLWSLLGSISTSVMVIVWIKILIRGIRHQTEHRLSPKEIEPTCGCGHHRAFHDATTKGCRQRVSVGYRGEVLECRCQGYIGPEPLPAYYIPEITENKKETR